MLGAKQDWNELIRSAPPRWKRKISLSDWLFEREMEMIKAQRAK